MTEKIKLITDSACDIPEEVASALNIDIMSFYITIGEESYVERVDFTPQEFYQRLLASETLPATSQITVPRFEEKFEEAYAQGYSDLILVTINSKGSNTHNSALLAKELFFKHHSEAAENFHIYVIDALSYSVGYGYPVVLAAQKIQEGCGAEEVVAFLQDYLAHVEIYFTPYTLEFAKKSGRISVAAAFVGEMLGLRPIIRIKNGEMEIIEKVRGDKSVIPALVRYAAKRMTEGSDYIVASGLYPERASELAEEMKQAIGQDAAGSYELGSAITINSGPNAVGIAIRCR